MESESDGHLTQGVGFCGDGDFAAVAGHIRGNRIAVQVGGGDGCHGLGEAEGQLVLPAAVFVPAQGHALALFTGQNGGQHRGGSFEVQEAVLHGQVAGVGIVGQEVGRMVQCGGGILQHLGIVPGGGQGNVDGVQAPVGEGVGIVGGVDQGNRQAILRCPVAVLAVGDHGQGGTVLPDGGAELQAGHIHVLRLAVQGAAGDVAEILVGPEA